MALKVDNGQSCYILSRGGVLTLDLAGSSSSDNTPVLGWSPHFDLRAENRVWTFHDHGSAWKLINAATGTALTMTDGSSENGTAIVCTKPFDSDRQLWKFDQVQPGGQVAYWTITNKASNTVMDLNNGGASDGTRITGWDSNGSWNQQWILIPVQ